MAPIHSQQDLLAHLAGNGDPSAFYTLAAPCACSTYVCLRKQGKSHGEAMTILVPFLKKIYKNYLAGSCDVPFNAWYESQRIKYMPDTVDSQDEKAVLEEIPPIDISHFESQMRLVLQQNYSKLRLAKKESVIRRTVFSPFLLKFAAVALGVLVVLIGLQFYLSFAGITISFSVSSSDYNRTVSLPSAPFFSKAASQTPLTATTPAAPAADTAQPQKTIIPDSISVPLPVKKPALPRRHARTASSPMAPAVDALAKPLSDTNAVKALTEKSASLTEKPSALPSFQTRQPAALPESSVVAP
jgi:hypothetical protein